MTLLLHLQTKSLYKSCVEKHVISSPSRCCFVMYGQVSELAPMACCQLPTQEVYPSSGEISRCKSNMKIYCSSHPLSSVLNSSLFSRNFTLTKFWTIKTQPCLGWPFLQGGIVQRLGIWLPWLPLSLCLSLSSTLTNFSVVVEFTRQDRGPVDLHLLMSSP